MSTDPCAEAERLRTLRTEIITGGRPVKIREGEREVQYGPADIARLDSLIAELDAACARATATPPRRSARRMRFGRS